MRSKYRLTGIAMAVSALVVTSIDASAGTSAAGRSGVGQAVRAVADQITVASWYGWGFARRPTASGEPFNPMALTAAHRTLPLGTRVRVTNLRNGRSVVLRINDRGPYHKGRGIDLSREAAHRLRMVDQGLARVRIERLPAKQHMAPVPTAMSAWPSGAGGIHALSI